MNVVDWTNQIGPGAIVTVFVTITGLTVAFFAIKNSIMSTQKTEVDFATLRAKRLAEENVNFKSEIIRLQAQTDLSTVLKKIDEGHVQTSEQIEQLAGLQERTISSLDQILKQLKTNSAST